MGILCKQIFEGILYTVTRGGGAEKCEKNVSRIIKMAP